MRKFLRHIFVLGLISGLCAGSFWACSQQKKDKGPKAVSFDLEEITDRGVIRVVTGYSPISYFVYRGQPMGYEYELLGRLAEYLDIEFELVVARDIDEMIEMLYSGEADLIAYSLTITRERRQRVGFTNPLYTTRQVLVQRKPENWRRMQLHVIDRELIRNPIELAGETVYVRRASSYLDRIQNLQNEIGEDINIVEADAGLTTEDLIRMVARRDIDYTISDENIARLNRSSYPNLDVQTPISLPQQIAWAVRPNAPELLEALNYWLDDIQDTADFYVLYNKYFENTRAYRVRLDSNLMFTTGGQISDYDDLIQEAVEELGWNWKLIASLIYQESQFDPNARSWAGAVGLMQLMPRTARAYGATDPTDPEENIKAGINFLQWLDTYWKEHIEDKDERMKFVLGSYNVGQGHVQDARRLAEKYGADPNIWDGNVARYLLKKSQPKYYTDEVVRHGYCRGSEPVNYVNSILYIYGHYQAMARLQPEEDEDDAAIVSD